MLEDFTKETGIKVRYDTFDSNDMLETKLLAGSSGYDVVVPTAYFLARQIKAGVFQKLDKAKLPNLATSGPRSPAASPCYDPGNQYAVNYMWGTTGIGYNVKKARELLGATAGSTAGTWCSSRRTSRSSRIAASTCSIPPTTCLPAALHYLGPRSELERARPICEKAADLLTKIRPFVRKFHSSEYLNALASGEICLVVGFSGDIKQAQKRAAEAKNGVEIGYAIPKEGAQLWFDNLAIPKERQERRRGARTDQLPAQARSRGEEHEFHLLRQRQSGEPDSSTRRSSRTRRSIRTRRRWRALHHHRRTIRRRSG